MWTKIFQGDRARNPTDGATRTLAEGDTTHGDDQAQLDAVLDALSPLVAVIAQDGDRVQYALSGDPTTGAVNVSLVRIAAQSA